MEKLFQAHFPEGGFPARMTAIRFIDADCWLMVDGIAVRTE